MRATAILKSPWSEPIRALEQVADRDFTIAFLSGGGGARGRWSYLLTDPSDVFMLEQDDPRDPFLRMRTLLGDSAPNAAEGPPFQGGLAGLLGYDLGARLEPAGHRGTPDWPDVACGLYESLLAFDHVAREVYAIGRGPDQGAALARARAASDRLGAGAEPGRSMQAPLAASFDPLTPGSDYEAAVADVVSRIAAGEIFQANVARPWGGRLAAGVRPFEVSSRLSGSSPAPFAAYFKLPGRAVVSNSPERFVRVSNDGALDVEARPIKGTRPRGADAAEDEALRQELLNCVKDRAENLMIVDLMRNDLARVCPPGAVGVSELFKIETFTNVHHLVSTVTGRLAPGLGALDLLEAAFPPGSVTGAPKVQAMKVIADYEPARGPYCGSMFWAGFAGGCDSSVLIRTIAMMEDEGGWRYEARAGAGIVADSDPVLERLETEAKIDAIRRALTDGRA
jgi:para-aminobenzoate synthetase component 1